MKSDLIIKLIYQAQTGFPRHYITYDVQIDKTRSYKTFDAQHLTQGVAYVHFFLRRNQSGYREVVRNEYFVVIIPV